MRVEENVPLAPLTTLRLGGPARRLVTVESEREAIDVVREVEARGEKLLVLGGGSNLVVADEGFDGTVLRIGTRGFRTSPSPEGKVEISVAAGESWDDFVASIVDDGFAGVECLAGIPGRVGAVPMQNVGAYGQDVSETIVRVRAWDRVEKRVVDIDRADCGFAYRSSVFRGRDRHVLLEVTFALESATESKPLRYAELTNALAIQPGARAPLAEVRRTIVELRRKKGMVLDPSDPDTTSAGSFFTNPILDPEAYAALRVLAPEVPSFPEADGRTKVSAAWLIERAGFAKGFAGIAEGRVAISGKHSLALTNRGAGSTEDLLALARHVREGVRARFGVGLENEPVMVGVGL